MLKSARFQSFTTVPDGTWEFAPGLNVIVGENGTGKSHVLKAIYSLLKVQFGNGFSRATLEHAYADKLVAVLRPESLGRLVKRNKGNERCEIELEFGVDGLSGGIAFANNARSKVEILQLPQKALHEAPVYLPTRELITLSPWFVPLFDNYHLEFEETWRDTVSLLGAPSVRGPREAKVARLLEPLEEAMGGRVVVHAQTGRSYLKLAGGLMEMPLVAEGLRKFAMLAQLIRTGALLSSGFLFWDEPETNLNPRLIKTLAASIVHLASSGVQVFIASHSLFLLREFEMLAASAQHRKLGCRYFALAHSGEDVLLEQGASLSDLQTLVLLDEELAQSDRFMEEGV